MHGILQLKADLKPVTVNKKKEKKRTCFCNALDYFAKHAFFGNIKTPCNITRFLNNSSVK